MLKLTTGALFICLIINTINVIPDSASILKEEYIIFDAIISKYNRNHKLVAVKEYSYNRETFTPNLKLRFRRPLEDILITNYNSVNRDKHMIHLELLKKSGSSSIILAPDRIANDILQGNGWSTLLDLDKHISSLVCLSRVGFNDKKKIALVYCLWMTRRAFVGNFITLKKTFHGWIIDEQVTNQLT